MKKLLLVLLLLSLVSLFVGVGQLSFSALMQGDEVAAIVVDEPYTTFIGRTFNRWWIEHCWSYHAANSIKTVLLRLQRPAIECAMLGYVLSLVIFGHGESLLLDFLDGDDRYLDVCATDPTYSI
ncbi:hypothetical protein ACT691_00765 [Vibrio metschnikovii]